MGNELGDLRKQNRELQQMLQQMQAPQEETPTYSLDENPQEFIQQAVGQAIEERLGVLLAVGDDDWVSADWKPKNRTAPPWVWRDCRRRVICRMG